MFFFFFLHELLGVQTQCILYLFCCSYETEVIKNLTKEISYYLEAKRRASILEKRRIDDLKRKKEEDDLEKKYKDKEADPETKYKDGEADSETKKFEVFLSFRGEDTRYNFLGYLYEALIQKGFHTFIYDENFDGGKPISQEPLKVIWESRFAIVIISNNYASSTWCLDELAHIIHCKNETGIKVLPVFYYVNPSEVRRQMGTFEQAFIKHERHFSKERVEKWRYALREVCNLSGFHLNNTR